MVNKSMKAFLAAAFVFFAAPVAAQQIVASPAVTVPVSVANGGTGVSAIPTWSIYLNSSVTGFATSTAALIPFDTKLFDAQTICDVATNKGRCTPNKAGTYQISASFFASGTLTAAAAAYCYIYKNGAAYKGSVQPEVAGFAGLQCTTRVAMNGTTDYLEIWGAVDTAAGTWTATGSATLARFDGGWVGP